MSPSFTWWMVVIGYLLILALSIVVYLTPSIIASRYEKQKRSLITTLNVALGWTGIGWIAALIWAIKDETEDKNQH
ncbi:MAG: superinfection immunity protein [Candidatus Saccharibacteria bacterium]